MAIGLCCQYLQPHTKRNGTVEYKNSTNERNLQYGRFLEGKYPNTIIEDLWINNAKGLFSTLKKIYSEGFRSFRVSSNLFPLHDLIGNMLDKCDDVKLVLEDIGKFVIENKMRLTSHPDQFVVISSNDISVINKSIKMLEHHAWVFDTMGLPKSPYYNINIHGGTKGNQETLINSIMSLKDNLKSRLTLENDERSYSVSDLLNIYEQTNIPIVFDNHHHTFNMNNISCEDAFNLCCDTWGDIKPMTHLSNTKVGLENSSFTDRRKHSEYVHHIPKYMFDANNNGKIDIEFEFKMKNIAIKKAVQEFQINLG